VIALDRYRGILWPLKGEYSKLNAKIICLFVWIVSVFLAIPNLLVYEVSKDYFIIILVPTENKAVEAHLNEVL